jgi:uncharacterized protein YbjT (DUF2867 family)
LTSSPKIAVIAGDTGAVGSALVPRLLTRYARVIALTRRPLPQRGPNLELADAKFDALDAALPRLDAEPLDVFCALGTTLKRAGSRAAFRQVDFDYVVALGAWAVRAGANSFVVVSAVGADSSSAAFYGRVKGEMETALRQLRLKRLVIVRPSLLEATRAEFRAAEWLALQIARPLSRLVPARIRPVSVEDVAAAMLLAARGPESVAIVENSQLLGARDRLARQA